EHVLPERSMQPRHCTAHHDEARTGDAAGCLEVQPPQPLAELYVVARREVEAGWRTDARDLDVTALVGTLRNRFVQHVRQIELPAIQLHLHARQLAVSIGEGARDCLAL